MQEGYLIAYHSKKVNETMKFSNYDKELYAVATSILLEALLDFLRVQALFRSPSFLCISILK